MALAKTGNYLAKIMEVTSSKKHTHKEKTRCFAKFTLQILKNYRTVMILRHEIPEQMCMIHPITLLVHQKKKKDISFINLNSTTDMVKPSVFLVCRKLPVRAPKLIPWYGSFYLTFLFWVGATCSEDKLFLFIPPIECWKWIIHRFECKFTILCADLCT